MEGTNLEVEIFEHSSSVLVVLDDIKGFSFKQGTSFVDIDSFTKTFFFNLDNQNYLSLKVDQYGLGRIDVLVK